MPPDNTSIVPNKVFSRGDGEIFFVHSICVKCRGSSAAQTMARATLGPLHIMRINTTRMSLIRIAIDAAIPSQLLRLSLGSAQVGGAPAEKFNQLSMKTTFVASVD